MLSTFTESLFQRLLVSFPADRTYEITAFRGPPMPSSVMQFLTCNVALHVLEETSFMEIPASVWFDSKAEAVTDASRSLSEALVATGRVPAPLWESSLREAVEHVVAFLVCPVPTLCKFVCRQVESPPPMTVMTRRVHFFEQYDYIREAALEYLQKEEGDRIDEKKFLYALYETDRETAGTLKEEDWLRLLHPLFALAEQAKVGVSASLLSTFFEEKGAAAIIERLMMRYEQEDTLNENALHCLLLEEMPVPASTLPPDTPPPENADPQPLWKQFQLQGAKKTDSSTPDKAVQPRWMQFRGAGNESGDLLRLEQAVLGAVTHRATFVTCLFNGNMKEYERILRQLHDAPTWKEATRIIREDVFHAFEIDMYSEPAVLFTDAAQARYKE